MPTEITRFKCDHCRKHYSTARDAKKHEARCIFNQATRACPTCDRDDIDRLKCSLSARPVDKKCLRECEKWAEKS